MVITFLGIATSILTLAVAYLFSGYESAKTLAWIIEAALILTVYRRYNNPWILTAAILVQIVGMGQSTFLDPTFPSDMVLLGVIFGTLLWNIWTLQDIPVKKTWSIEIVLFASSFMWYGFLIGTLMTEYHWGNGNIILLTEALLIVFTILLSHSFKKVYFSGLMLSTAIFFVSYGSIMDIDKWLYFMVPFVLFSSQYYFAKKQHGIFALIQWFIIGIGIFVVSSIWVNNHFTNEYMMTIWWSLWIGSLLTIGMRQKIALLRSLGLIVYMLTLGKILFVDLWRIFSSDE